jgi:hypothetical protein
MIHLDSNCQVLPQNATALTHDWASTVPNVAYNNHMNNQYNLTWSGPYTSYNLVSPFGPQLCWYLFAHPNTDLMHFAKLNLVPDQCHNSTQDLDQIYQICIVTLRRLLIRPIHTYINSIRDLNVTPNIEQDKKVGMI